MDGFHFSQIYIHSENEQRKNRLSSSSAMHRVPCHSVSICCNYSWKISHFIVYHHLSHRYAHCSCLVMRYLKYGNRLKSYNLCWMNINKKTKTKQTKQKRKKTKANGRLLSLSHFPWLRGRITAHCFHLIHCVFCLPICLPVCFSAAARIGSNWACERAGRQANELTSKQTYEWSKSESHEKSCKFIFIRSILHN